MSENNTTKAMVHVPAQAAQTTQPAEARDETTPTSRCPNPRCRRVPTLDFTGPDEHPTAYLMVCMCGVTGPKSKTLNEAREGWERMAAGRYENKIDAFLYEPIPCLDHGFVQLIDVMGDDAAIANAARVSTGSVARSVDDDRNLICYLMEHRHCYDQETQVLTDRGFVSWALVTESDRLGIWDPEVQSLCYEQPIYLTQQRYSGPMYRVEHGGVDLLVTPDHRMWVQLKTYDRETGKQPWGGFQLIPASELANRTMVRYSKVAPYLGDRWDGGGFHSDTEALLQFIGFFVGDGSALGTQANYVEFHLKKKRKIEFLMGCLSRLGWTVDSREIGDGTFRIAVKLNGIAKLFKSQFYDQEHNKVLPAWALRLNRSDAHALLRGLRASDGSEKRGTWIYSTSSPALAEQVQLVLLHAGESAHVSCNGNGMWIVSVLSRMREPVINQGVSNTSMVEYDGIVYCAHTRTGILVVRRNGKIVLSGNTTPFEMCEIKLHCKMPIFVARQWIRHRTASVNELSARYREIETEFFLPSVERLCDSDKYAKGKHKSPLPMMAEDFQMTLNKCNEDDGRLYDALLRRGFPREIARVVLPVSTYTEWIWKIDLQNLFHFLKLRTDPHAQKEMRVYAEAIESIVARWVPVAWRAWRDFVKEGISLSRQEMNVVRILLNDCFTYGAIQALLEQEGLTASQAERATKRILGDQDE